MGRRSRSRSPRKKDAKGKSGKVGSVVAIVTDLPKECVNSDVQHLIHPFLNQNKAAVTRFPKSRKAFIIFRTCVLPSLASSRALAFARLLSVIGFPGGSGSGVYVLCPGAIFLVPLPAAPDFE